jgi:3',5'-cyclic AMP phosphodiesterase CpdA
MRIAHISDLHYTQIIWNPLRLLSKRLFGNLNWIFKRNSEFSPDLLIPLPGLFQELGVDLVLFGGDFTTTAAKEEYQLAKRFVSQIAQKWMAIPGNHDHYTYCSYRKKYFYNYFSHSPKPISCPTDFFTLKDHGIEASQISSNWWIIALDTARATNPYSSRGLFSQKLEAYMKEILTLIPKESQILILNHYPFFQNDAHRRTLDRGEALMEILKTEPRIHLYLHGHTHRHIIADLQPNNLPIILDSGSCTKTKQATWNLIDLKEKGCEISVYTWDKQWKTNRKETLTWARK